ncbi:MAG: class I SAM-dependent DNA methyltransferase [Ruminococcus sp.]|nr:class I SAM-dependent DNA methyltransferase [Ruminococcus sp.]
MTENERRTKAKDFAEFWKNRGYEKGESQPFWLSLLRDVLGIQHPEQFISFEEQAKLDHTSFIDGYIASTHVLIEQKSKGKDLRKAIRQSDGTLLTPFQQAQRYSSVLPYSQRPRWIVTCNFEEFLVYDMEKPNGEPESILLKNLSKEYYRLQFLVDTGDDNIKREMEVSIKAGRLVGILYDEILKQYHNPEDPEILKSLNMLCVRLVFCLYAEDAGVFDGHGKFYNYINSYSAKDMRKALIDLFRMLDTKEEDRDEYEDEILLSFPYVNGGLFKDSDIVIPQMSDTIRDILLNQASADFDWSDISPTIFGAVFESTLNPETRRSGGMHYTSIENIHKVIDPLFLDDLRQELSEIKALKVTKTRVDRLNAFKEKLGNLTFLDPACGSGNFLTETYISLRRLENEALKAIEGDQILLDMGDTIKVTIDQFYGIEINDFAVTVAKTALWIAESQMMKETEDIIHKDLNFLPLKSNAYIVEGNALRIDWEEVVDKTKLNYIMGNPPFVGARLMSKEQKEDLLSVFGKKWKNAGNMDYVSCWYKKATELMHGTSIRSALVSTNSVSQGEQVATLWKTLFEMGVHIDFAHRTFRWDSEASLKAHVHCVIIGFSIAANSKPKLIFDGDRHQNVENINAYLLDAPNVFILNRSKPICNVPKMDFGSMPNDGGYLSNYSTEQKNDVTKKYPESEKLFKKIVGAQEFINDRERWCLWLKGISPNVYIKIPPVYEAVVAVKELREHSSREATKKLATVPMLFGEIRQPETNYLLVPSTSSENRKYIPIGFMPPEVISNNANLIVPCASHYHLGIITSNVHMAWVRAVCGRLKSDYRYSVKIVYNNFPWPSPTDEQKAKIEQTAQAILDARALYPDCSLADLYDEVAMPPELRKAHQENDKAVMRAYGFDIKTMTESTCVAELMKMYQELTKEGESI